jgi:hypothetical protein
MYDASRQVWTQTYLSTLGTVLYVEGYLRAQNVVLTGTHVATDGRIALHRMMWTAKGKEAYQLWEYSKDGGKIWEPIYEGVLRPAKKPFPLKELQQRGLAMAGDERQ